MVVKNVDGKLVWLLIVSLILSIVSLVNYAWGRYVIFAVAAMVGVVYAFRRKGKMRIKFDAFQYLFLLFCIYTGISSLWALNMSDSIEKMTTLLSIVLCYFPIYTYYRDCGTVEHLVSAIKWGAVAVSIYTIVFFGLDRLLLSVQSASLRIADGFANANSLGLCASVGILIQSWQLLFQKGKKWENLTFLPTILIVGASQSRKTVVFVLAGVFLLIVLRYKDEKKPLNTILSVFFALAVTVGILYGASQMELFSGLTQRMLSLLNFFTGSGKVDHSTQVRYAMMDLGLEWWLKNPLFGIGMGNPHIIVEQYLFYDAYLHNNYVELLCGGGIVGFLLYYSMHFFCLKQLFRFRKVNEPLFALMITWCFIILMMDYGKVSYYAKIDVFYLMTIFLSIEEMKRHNKKRVSVEMQR